jgi:hypothetical protein
MQRQKNADKNLIFGEKNGAKLQTYSGGPATGRIRLLGGVHEMVEKGGEIGQ